MKNINLCHLYNKTTSSTHVGEILNSFENSVSVDMSQVDSVGEYSVFVIEVEHVDKELTLNIRRLLESSADSLIYFLVPKSHNIMFFQLAFILNAKAIITQRQETSKVISKIKNDFAQHKSNCLEKNIGKSLIKNQMFLLFKAQKLIFASSELLKYFNCKNLFEIEEKIFLEFNIDEVLTLDSALVKSIVAEDEKSEDFFIKSIALNSEDEKLISFEKYIKKGSNCNYPGAISSRISFIELLKDKFLEKSISTKSFSIITLQIENLKKLSLEFSKEEIETLSKELLFYIEVTLNTKLSLAQFDMEFYVILFENISFEDLKKKAKGFHMKLPSFTIKQKLKPFISLFVFDINNIELNDILETLEKIEKKKLSNEQIKSKNLEFISGAQDEMSEKEIIELQLNTNFINNTEFKLLNIYKGLCINTSSKIIKKNEDSIYIKIEHLQGILMQNEKETVIQLPSHSKDIRANVKYVNIDEKFAILEGFSFLNTNANARKYSRVTCSTRTPIVMLFLGATINGYISDISIKSIAIRAKFSKAMNDLKLKKVKLSFTLPLKTSVDGFVKLSLDAKIILNSCEGELCKIICEFDEDPISEAIIMEYVYNRQKELIVEMKKLVKNSNF